MAVQCVELNDSDSFYDFSDEFLCFADEMNFCDENFVLPAIADLVPLIWMNLNLNNRWTPLVL